MRCITRPILALLLCAGTAHAAGNGYSRINPSESGMGYGGGTFAGPIAWCVITQVVDDATPEVGTLGGCSAGTGGNIVKTNTGHSAPVAITDFDGALVGQVLYVHGAGGANATTIANAGNFTLEEGWTGTLNNELVLWTVAASTFVEVTRHNGPRTFNGTLSLENAETVDNASDGKIGLTGVGGTNNEDAILDFETVADTVGVSTSTGVTTWDWGALGLAAGSADMSDGNITNVGDVQLDSLTADGTSIQANATTTILQQNLDLAAGNAMTLDSHADAELTAATGTQSFVSIQPEILQTSTAAYIALEVDVTESSVGSGTGHLLSLEVASAPKLTVDNGGIIGGVNSESLSNATDGSWIMTGVGGTNNEDAELDFEATADTITVASSTGVTTWDWVSIGLAAGSADMSDGNITNVGDVQLDSLTADAIGVGLAGVAITESAATDTTLSITHTLNDTGAPDATEDFTAIKVDVTETDKTGWATVNLIDLQVDTVSKFKVTDAGAVTFGGGMSLGGDLDMNSNAVVEVTSLGGSNAETFDNLTDGSWVMTGVGGGQNEDAEFDLDATADTVTIGSSTGVTAWDWVAIGLAAGSADLSDGNLTNVGDVQADSVTADGTALQTNATTTIVQQNLDLASGNAITLDSHADAELTAASGSQSFVKIAPEILQTSTAGYIALEIDATESSEGSVTDYLASFEVANAPKFTVDSDGNTVNAGTLSVTGEVDLTANLALTAGGDITTTANGDIGLTPNGSGVVEVTDAEVYIGDGTYSWTHTPVLACEGIFEVDGAAYMDSSLTVATTTTMNGALTLDDTGSSVNSPMISLKGDSGGTEVEGQIQLMYGADPYVRISVDDDDSTPAMTAIIDIHDQAISFANDNTTDLGASGANRPKDLYLAGNATLGADLKFAATADVTSTGSGIVCMGGLGSPTFDEDICFDTDFATNAVTMSSTTAAATLDSGAFSVKIPDSKSILFGTGNDTRFRHNIVQLTPHTLQIGLGAESRTLLIVDGADTGETMIVDAESYPTLRIHSDDATVDTEHIKFQHNGTNGVITVGTGGVSFTEAPIFPTRVKEVVIDLQVGGVNPAATPDTEFFGTYHGFGFDHDDEFFVVQWHVPEDWDGTTDMSMDIHWAPTAGDVIADTETVKFDCTYRLTDHHAAGNEAYDRGTVVSVTNTYTQSGAGTDKQWQLNTLTLDYDHGDQPIVVDYQLGIKCDRDVAGDTYSGEVIVPFVSIEYNSTALSTQ